MIVELKHLDLFSGIGGFALAARWVGFETVQFVENEPYCQKVLVKNFPEVPIHGDIKTFRGQPGSADLITGGFPCQPFSCAGKRRGSEDDRALWPEMFRIIKEVRPTWVLGENVAGFASLEIDTPISDLEGIGYVVQSFIIPAVAIDAPHRRDRVWIVAHTKHNAGCAKQRTESRKWENQSPQQNTMSGRGGENVANAQGKPKRSGLCSDESTGQRRGRSGDGNRERNTWPTEPDVGRVAYGIPGRVDRLRGLGNAIVPQVAYQILKAIKEADIEGAIN